jgi:hypothetical protein
MEDLSNTQLPAAIPVHGGLQADAVGSGPSFLGHQVAANQDGTSGASIPGLTSAPVAFPAPVTAPTQQAQDHQQANAEAVAQVAAALSPVPVIPEGMQSVVAALKGASVEGGQ